MKINPRKLFFFITILVIFSLVLFLIFYTASKSDSTIQNLIESNPDKFKFHRPNNSIKYILQWSSGQQSPFYLIYQGNESFTKNNCTYTNCYITDDRNYLVDYRLFHAIMFSGNIVKYTPKNELPKIRYANQKYIFAAMESAHNYPLCSPFFDGFFNWTWTYRLDSDVRWGYITFYHPNGSIAGPHHNMVWPDHVEPISNEIKEIIKHKTRAVAWFVSNCKSYNKREQFSKQLEEELQKYGHTLDVFGKCGPYKCGRNEAHKCNEMLERVYYFYLSFENSFAEDYVTEKVLTALLHKSVPVVYGAANYSRFLPPGSYLDARELGPERLAETIASIIDNKTAYYEFFKWKNHYTYKQTSSNEDVCNLCALLNDEEKFGSFSVYKNFRKWWYPDYKNECRV